METPLDKKEFPKETDWFLLLFPILGILIELLQSAIFVEFVFMDSEYHGTIDYLLIFPVINLCCWIGMLLRRKAAYYLFLISFLVYLGTIILFFGGVDNHYFLWFQAIAVILMAGQLHKMDRWF